MAKFLFLTLISPILLISCNHDGKNSHEAGHDNHAAHDSVSAPAVADSAAPAVTENYSGILPCADCQGIETSLSLKSDYTYQIHQLYQGRKSTGPGSNEISSSGKWMKHGEDTIHLRDVKDAPSIYIRTDSSLIQLDMQGKRIEGKLADKYILKKNK